jgi:cobalt ABC transporter, permease protein cbiQ
MADIRSKLTELYSLEQLSLKNTSVHKLHPFSKLVVTLVYILCVVFHGRYDFWGLTPFLFYPVVVMAIGEIPFKMIFKRALIALPFCLFAGISNIIFDKTAVIKIGNLVVTGGVCSFIAILARSYLCVSAVLILVALTPFNQLTFQLKRIHIPNMIVILIEMIYRYIGVLIEEADTMLIAYRLRNPKVKWPYIRDIGPFIGQLFLRSMSRAERIYAAMKCRGYGIENISAYKRKLSVFDYIYVVICCLSSIIFTILF